MKLLGSRYSAPEQREIVKEAASAGASIEAIAALHLVDVDALRCCVTLYKELGDASFEPDAAQRFELEIFKLKYPNGAPYLGFFGELKRSFRDNRRLIFYSTIIAPLGVSLVVGGLLFATGDQLVEGLSVGLGCATVMFTLLFVGILFLTAWETSRNTAKSKVKELVYLRERRKVVSKQEVAGALQLAVDGEDLQGGLEVVQDAGGLALVDAQDDISNGKFGPPDEVAAALAMGYEVADSDDVRPDGGGWASAGRMHQGYPVNDEPAEQPQPEAEDAEHED